MFCSSERREAIQVKGLANYRSAVNVHGLLLREERSYPGKKGWPTFVLLSMHMLYYSKRRETIQVKKGLAYHLSVVKLVNALLLRDERSYPGKKKRAGLL
jgi:hypothetical protein